MSYFHRAQFLKSAAELKHLPDDGGIEVAFAGRSNAGKSSALNCLCGHKGLAKTSKTPGRTQLINLFELDEQRRLVDLPGYGYAKVPGGQRKMATNLNSISTEARLFSWFGIAHGYSSPTKRAR